MDINERLKIGTYIKTEDGRIGKIIEIEKAYDVTYINFTEPKEMTRYVVDTNYNFDDEPDGYFLEDIINVSEDIVDLIQPGDYVNGLFVFRTGYNEYDTWGVTVFRLG